MSFIIYETVLQEENEMEENSILWWLLHVNSSQYGK